MSLLEHLYRDEDQDGGDLEQIIEQDREHDAVESDGDHPQSEAEEEAPRRVDPTKEKKVVKNPRLTLNPKRLTGPRGIHTIQELFQDFKFKGKGHEKEDLDVVMKKLEYWAHRLYPKFKFDDCLDKIESLGKKKEVTNHVRKIRLDLLDNENINVEVQHSDNENGEEPATDDVAFDDFDRLLNQQIALARSTPAPPKPNETPSSSAIFDSLQTNSTVVQPAEQAVPAVPKPSLTDEQKERILMNRKLAEQKRLERIKLLEEQSKSTTDENVIEENCAMSTDDVETMEVL